MSTTRTFRVAMLQPRPPKPPPPRPPKPPPPPPLAWSARERNLTLWPSTQALGRGRVQRAALRALRLFGTMTTSESCRGHFLGRSIAASGRPITSTDQRGAFLNTIGHNVRIDYRWGTTYLDRGRRYAEELVALAPDVILASGTSTVGPLLRATRSVPIVFAGVADPVGAGYVG